MTHLNYRKELAKARNVVKELPRDGRQATLEAYWEVCCGDVLLAEENLRKQVNVWENTSLVKEFLDIASYLEGYDHMLDPLYAAVSRIKDVLPDHPRLQLETLKFMQHILHRIESQCDAELCQSEDMQKEISIYRHNITCADKNDFENIQQIRHLKQDPVEWSSKYENIIDEANRKIYSLLEGHPRVMGFCFTYWHAKKQILREEYGIEWKSPEMMNPNVIFD